MTKNEPAELASLKQLRTLIEARQRQIIKQTDALQYMYVYGQADERSIALDAIVDVNVALPFRIKSHPAFKWLQSRKGFGELYVAINEAPIFKIPDTASTVLLLRLLGAMIFWLTLSVSAQSTGWRPRVISTAQKRAAMKNAKALMRDLDLGVGATDFTFGTTQRLRQMLVSFCDQLAAPNKRGYSGRSAERTAMEGFAGELLDTESLKPRLAAIVMQHFASVCGFNVSFRTVQRYVRTAKTQNEKLHQHLRDLRQHSN